MSKPLLVLQPDQFTSFTSNYLQGYWRQFFTIEIYDDSRTYDRRGTLFVFWWLNDSDELPMLLKNRGYCVMIDNLWEYPIPDEHFYRIQHPYWFWFNESLWWQQMGHDRYLPNRNLPLKSALMPVRKKTTNRDYFVSKISPYLDCMIWSYDSKKLPNDFDPSLPTYQRAVNFDWYDQTFCSVVVETCLDGPISWFTEKSMRPMAFYHPYMILSSAGVLDLIRGMGFETFKELFDESYNEEPDFVKRCEIIVGNVSRLHPGQYDSITLQKMQHNRDHFFNTAKIHRLIEAEIIAPMLEHLNATQT